MLAFCAYTSGSIISYLCRWPRLCPQLCASADKAFNGTVDALSTFADKWPLAGEWVELLRGIAQHEQPQLVRPRVEVSSRESLLNTIVTTPPLQPVSPTSAASAVHHVQAVVPSDHNGLNTLTNAAAYSMCDPQTQIQGLSDGVTFNAPNLFSDPEISDYVPSYFHCNFADWQV